MRTVPRVHPEDGALLRGAAHLAAGRARCPGRSRHSFRGGPLARPEQRDAPLSYQGGNAMQRAGSRYVCGELRDYERLLVRTKPADPPGGPVPE